MKVLKCHIFFGFAFGNEFDTYGSPATLAEVYIPSVGKIELKQNLLSPETVAAIRRDVLTAAKRRLKEKGSKENNE